MTDLVFRPLEPGETAVFTAMPDPDHECRRTGVAWLGRDFAETLASGHYRPQWTWVALRDGDVVARAAWWGGPDDAEPVALDWLDPGDDPRIGAQLLRAAKQRADYVFILPPDWHDNAPVHAAAVRRIEAARLAGMAPFVERLHYTWRADGGLPERSGRLTFAPPPDDAAVLDVLREILGGTLDAHSRRDVERLGLDGAARAGFDQLAWFPAPRDWWRFAYDTEGDVVGIVVPTRNYTNATIAYVGVRPGHRGHGYAFDLLVEGTRGLAGRGETEIQADTDTTNAPMAATFERAGYFVTQRRLDLTYE